MLYFGEYAETVALEGMLFMYEYREILCDLVAAFLGYMAWQNYTDFASTEYEPWRNSHVKYEVGYYLHRTYLDYNNWKSIHHLLCLGYMYWGWAFKAALSTSFFFGSVSNCFLGLMQKHPSMLTKVSFAGSFFVTRILYGTWIIVRINQLPVRGTERIILPMTWGLYAMQWWWFRKVYRAVCRTLGYGGDAVESC